MLQYLPPPSPPRTMLLQAILFLGARACIATLYREGRDRDFALSIHVVY